MSGGPQWLTAAAWSTGGGGLVALMLARALGQVLRLVVRALATLLLLFALATVVYWLVATGQVQLPG